MSKDKFVIREYYLGGRYLSESGEWVGLNFAKQFDWQQNAIFWAQEMGIEQASIVRLDKQRTDEARIFVGEPRPTPGIEDEDLCYI